MNPVQVPAPPVNPLRIGLVAGGRKPPPDDEGRWQQGIVYDPEFDDLGFQFPGENCDPEVVEPGEKGMADAQANNEWWPWYVGMSERCSTFSGYGRDFFEPKLRRQLLAQTSRLVEQSFSSGVIALSGTEDYTFAELGMPNRPLEDAAATEMSATPVGVVTAISLIVEGLAEEIGSARGMIHVPHFLLPYLDFYGQVIRNPSDGEFITLKSHDHIVIAGTGYRGFAPDGSEPDANSVWIYGTSIVDVRLESTDQIDLLPTQADEAISLRTNEIEYRVERLALASWDLSAHVACPVDLTDPGPEIGS